MGREVAKTACERAARGEASSRALVGVSIRRARLVTVAAAALLLVLAAVSLMLGRYPIDPAQAVLMLVDRVVPVERVWTNQQATLFFNVRLPRIALACMVGASLSAAGAAFQGTFRNPLVSPDVLGASQGAALGAAAALLAGAGSFAVSAWAFAAAMATVAVVMLVSARARASEHSLTVVLVGVMVSSLCQAGVSFAKLVADPSNQLPASMLLGASFLLVVDNVSRLAYTAEIPIGILTAFLGAPFFLYLIMTRRRGA